MRRAEAAVVGRVGERRAYPACCQSYACGRSGAGCAGCPCAPVLEEWRRWVAATAAVCLDETWARTTYVATRSAP